MAEKVVKDGKKETKAVAEKKPSASAVSVSSGVGGSKKSKGAKARERKLLQCNCYGRPAYTFANPPVNAAMLNYNPKPWPAITDSDAAHYQDKLYGKGWRVQNYAVAKDMWRCTVCGRETPA